MTATNAEKVYGAPAEWQQGATNYAGGTPAQAYERSRYVDSLIFHDARRAARKARSAAFARGDYPEGVVGLYVPRACPECGSTAPDTRTHYHPYNTASSND